MVEVCGFVSMDVLIDVIVFKFIWRLDLNLSKYVEGLMESQMLVYFKVLVFKNKVMKFYIGMGYYDMYVLSVIFCNILENFGWYMQYMFYQVEIV